MGLLVQRLIFNCEIYFLNKMITLKKIKLLDLIDKIF